MESNLPVGWLQWEISPTISTKGVANDRLTETTDVYLLARMAFLSNQSMKMGGSTRHPPLAPLFDQYSLHGGGDCIRFFLVRRRMGSVASQNAQSSSSVIKRSALLYMDPCNTELSPFFGCVISLFSFCPILPFGFTLVNDHV